MSGSQRVKQRRVYAGALILTGNLWLKIENAGVRVLSISEWHARAREVYRQAYNKEVISTKSVLAVPNWPGQNLAYVLRTRHPDWRSAILSGLRALDELHGTQIQDAGGTVHPMSHGDATVENVIYDEAAKTSKWCDFEMVHLPHKSVDWRQADDLRAFIYSAASFLSDDDAIELAEICIAGYKRRPTLAQFRKYVESNETLSLLHLAQAGMPLIRRVALEKELMKVL